MDSIDGYLEESHQSTVLEVIQSFMTSKRYPPPSLLRTIMDNLLVSETKFTAPHKNASFCWFFVVFAFLFDQRRFWKLYKQKLACHKCPSCSEHCSAGSGRQETSVHDSIKIFF